MRPERLVLASDLDGTLAHGSAAVRGRLIAQLREHPAATLVYVTGRTPAGAGELVGGSALPEPDVLIADVGTSVLRGLGPERISEIEAELERSWPGEAVVRDRLTNVDGLEPQEVRAPRRVSYWIEPVRRLRAGGGPDSDPFAARSPGDESLGPEAAALADRVAREATQRLDALEVDVVLSANVFLDVLPRGVNKGTTLRRVLRWLDAAEDDCVVAGDSLNDLALFETGLRAIAVGNCEPALRRRVADMERVYVAGEEGAGGILEGLVHYGHLRAGPEREG